MICQISMIVFFSVFASSASEFHYCYRSKTTESQCINPDALILNTANKINQIQFIAGNNYTIEIYNDGESPLDITNTNFDQISIAFLGNRKSKVRFIASQASSAPKSFKLSNITAIFTSSINESYNFVNNSVVEFKFSEISGTININNDRFLSDFYSLANINFTQIHSVGILLYAETQEQDLPPNTEKTIKIGSNTNSVTIYGFSQKTKINFEDKEKSSFVFEDIHSKISFEKGKYTLRIRNSDLVTIDRSKIDYLAPMLDLHLEKECNVTMTEPETSPKLRIFSEGNSTIEFTNNSIISTVSLINSTLRMSCSEDNLKIEDVNLYNSTLLFLSGETYRPVINKVTLVDNSVIATEGSQMLMEFDSLLLENVHTDNSFPNFTVLVKNDLYFHNSSTKFNFLMVQEKCLITFEWGEYPSEGIYADNLLLPVHPTIYIIKDGANTKNFIDKSSFTFCAPDNDDSFVTYDFSKNDENNYGFTPSFLLLSHSQTKINNKVCTEFHLTKNPAEIYPVVCYSSDSCNQFANYVKVPGESLNDLPTNTQILRIISNEVIPYDKPIVLSTLPKLQSKITLKIGSTQTPESKFTIALDENVNDKIDSIILIHNKVNFTTLGKKVNIKLNEFLIGYDVPLITNKELLSFSGSKYLKFPFVLDDAINPLDFKNVDVTFSIDRIVAIELSKNKANLTTFIDWKEFDISKSFVMFDIPKIGNDIFIPIVRKDKEVATLNILGSENFYSFGDEWNDYKGVAVEFHTAGRMTINVNSNTLPIRFRNSDKIQYPALDLKNTNAKISLINLPHQDIEFFHVNLISEHNFTLTINNALYNFDAKLKTSIKSNCKLYLNNATINGTVEMEGVFINNSLNLLPRATLSLNSVQIKPKTSINVNVIAGEASSILSTNNTVGINKINILWNVTDYLKYPPFFTKERILESSNSLVDKDIETVFKPKSMKISEGFIRPYTEISNYSVSVNFEGVVDDSDKLGSTQILGIITGVVALAVSVIIIIYTCVGRKKNRSHSYDHFLM